jgi:hypothetical protein
LALEIHAPVQDAHDLDPASPARSVNSTWRAGWVSEIAGPDSIGASPGDAARRKAFARLGDESDAAICLESAPLFGAVVPDVAQVTTRAR